MKTFFLSSILAVLSITLSAKKVATAKVNNSISQAFNSLFGSAQSVRWANSFDNLVKASFSNNGKETNAYFTEDGEYVASVVLLSLEQLPPKFKTGLSVKYKDAAIVEAVLLQDTDDAGYFVKVMVGGVGIIIKGDSNGLMKEVAN